MNTIIIEHVDNSTTALLEALFEKMGLVAKTKAEKKEEGTITNPAVIKAIEEYENDKSEQKEYTIPALKAVFTKMQADA